MPSKNDVDFALQLYIINNNSTYTGTGVTMFSEIQTGNRHSVVTYESIGYYNTLTKLTLRAYISTGIATINAFSDITYRYLGWIP
jgi:hypothetical protein